MDLFRLVAKVVGYLFWDAPDEFRIAAIAFSHGDGMNLSLTAMGHGKFRLAARAD